MDQGGVALSDRGRGRSGCRTRADRRLVLRHQRIGQHAGVVRRRQTLDDHARPDHVGLQHLGRHRSALHGSVCQNPSQEPQQRRHRDGPLRFVHRQYGSVANSCQDRETHHGRTDGRERIHRRRPIAVGRGGEPAGIPFLAVGRWRRRRDHSCLSGQPIRVESQLGARHRLGMELRRILPGFVEQGNLHAARVPGLSGVDVRERGWGFP